jgi:hypothetical protein
LEIIKKSAGALDNALDENIPCRLEKPARIAAQGFVPLNTPKNAKG